MTTNDPAILWMIWNPQRHAPTYRHYSVEAAHSEAERLARLCPGEVFVVLKAQYALRMKRPDPPPVDHVPLSQIGDEIPF
jgi:hypothetical protein